MRIKKLELKNFRGFEELTIDFPKRESGLAVFVGVNGSGKSSVLDAISNTFEEFIYELYSEQELKKNDKKKWFFSYSNHDIRSGADSFVINTYVNINDKGYRFGLLWNENIGSRIIDPPVGRLLQKENVDKFRGELIGDGYEPDPLVKERIELRNNPKILVYYSSKRSSIESPVLKPNTIKSSPMDTYENCFLSNVGFNDFFQWFRNVEDFENRKRLRENVKYRHAGLEAVRTAISSFLPGMSNPYVETTNRGEEFFIEKNGLKLSLSQLSEGEKSIIAIIGDIARRLEIANPKKELNEGEGIVLFDEIEKHLHPKWQRTIIPNLRRTFPNIQFIVTTHSPQVLSKVPKENVFVLNNFQLEETKPTLGRDSNSILWDIFGVEKRPPEAEKIFRKLYRTMDDPDKIKETAALLRDVEERYGYYDEEVIRARSQFDFLNEK